MQSGNSILGQDELLQALSKPSTLTLPVVQLENRPSVIQSHVPCRKSASPAYEQTQSRLTLILLQAPFGRLPLGNHKRYNKKVVKQLEFPMVQNGVTNPLPKILCTFVAQPIILCVKGSSIAIILSGVSFHPDHPDSDIFLLQSG